MCSTRVLQLWSLDARYQTADQRPELVLTSQARVGSCRHREMLRYGYDMLEIVNAAYCIRRKGVF